MNVLEVEQAKVAVLQAPDLLLLPGSLVMEELVRRGGRGPRRLILSLTFASAEVRLLVTLAKPLDLVVLNPAILPPSALDPLFLEVDETTSLVYILRGVREAMRQHQESQLSDGLLAHIPSSLAHLGEVCPGLAHELAVQGTRTTLLLKFVPEQAIALASVAALLKADRLEAAEHHYLLKLVFEQGAFLPEEWAVQFSPALAAMLPELQAVRVAGLGQAGNSQETLVEFLANSRQQVEGRLVRAVEAWEERARVMAPLLDAFLGGEEALAYPDLDTEEGLATELVEKARAGARRRPGPRSAMVKLGELGYQSEEGQGSSEEEDDPESILRLPNGMRYRKGGVMDPFLDLDKIFDPSNGGMIEMVQLPDIFLDHPTVSVTESDNEMVISDVDTGEFIAKKIIYD